VLQLDRATTYQATLAWRVWHGQIVGVSIEVPFIASPAFQVATSGRPLPKEYASLYLTPGVRVTISPNGPVSFFGGGVDVRAVRWLGFRGELRDVYTGARSFSIPTSFGFRVSSIGPLRAT
jgi:hypothetical protein